MHHTRPKNLNLMTIRFPLTAIASILHRISGFILFLLIPLLLWALDSSLNYSGFDSIQSWLANSYARVFFWLLFLPFMFHLIAGIKHLLSDLHIGNTRSGGKIAAMTVFVVFGVFVILAGVWLW